MNHSPKQSNKLHCPICFSEKVKQIYTGKDPVVTRYVDRGKIVISLFKCKSCGMLFLGPLNRAPEIIHEAYWKMLIESASSNFSVDRGSQIFNFAELDKYRKTNRLLEIGCGDGSLLKSIRDRGWQVTGIDFSQKAVELADKQYGLKAINAELNQELAEKLGLSSFDVIIMWGLIEHLGEPLKLLRLSNLLLRKGGIVVIYTPNANSIFHRLAKTVYYATGGLVKLLMERVIIAMHPLYFTPATLRDSLAGSGFRINRLELVDIDLNLIFDAHSQFWWSNRFFFYLARFLQKLSHLYKLQSHLLVTAEKT